MCRARTTMWSGFNGAAAFQLRKFPPPPPLLQPKGRFNGAAAFQLRKCRAIREELGAKPASMGPQLFSCGNHRTSIQLSAARRRFNGAAAFQLRKSIHLIFPATIPKTLQWGRSFSAAEIKLWCLGKVSAQALQWGRSFSAAEMATSL